MIIQDSLKKFGDYVLLMRRVFTIPDRWREFFKRYISEIYKLGIDSIPIVITISVFIGAVIAIQMQKNVVSPMIPAYAVGLATRDVILLEFSSSILCLILAGKVGSNIASEIGTMRVTEQIDALEIMGVNSANLLILPKIAAMVSFIPVLVVFSMASGIGCVHRKQVDRLGVCAGGRDRGSGSLSAAAEKNKPEQQQRLDFFLHKQISSES